MHFLRKWFGMPVQSVPLSPAAVDTMNAEAARDLDSGDGERNAGHEPVLSVRFKGLVVFGALIVYAVVIAVFVFHQKNQLLRAFEQIQESLAVDSVLMQADAAAFHAVAGVIASSDARSGAVDLERIETDYRQLREAHARVRERLPQFALGLDGVDAALKRVRVQPTRAALNALVAELVKMKNEFATIAEQSQQARRRMSDQYRQKTDSVAMATLFLGMMGLALLGTIMALFFKQLTADLAMLQQRALEIVNGYRGAPLPVRRHDEVGQLMTVVNSMATALDRREKELIVERQKYFHHEKMAAIGALAAGVAHEIGNPIAAISGVAQAMVERRACGGGPCSGDDNECRPELILAQTERLAAITREISEFSSSQPVEAQLLDLNAQLRSTASLLRYDRRLQGMELQLDLDPALPAIHGVADQITQVIMNLLINAMDALESAATAQPRIVISTKVDGERVRMTVEDNGPGMEQSVLDQAFDAFFTTKPAGKGTGLGLSLCYSIMQNHGGSIDIESAPGAGARVQVYFPTNEQR